MKKNNLKPLLVFLTLCLVNSASAQPNLELRKTLLQCTGAELTNLEHGYVKDYQVTEGLSSSSYSGFIERTPATVTHGCFVGELASQQCVVMNVNTDEYEAMGNWNDWQMQCVYSDRPQEGAIESKDSYPYKADYISLKNMLYKCGHDQGDQYPCHEGSNSTRSGIYQKQYLQDKTMLSVCANTAWDAPPEGQYVYCQYYNKKSKKSLFGFEFLQEK